MRKNTSILLLCAGIVLSLAGCQKGTTPSNLAGKAVRFGATSGSLSTRTDFTGDGSQDGSKTDEFGRKYLTHERINWAVGDLVMIASDNATVYQATTKFATYSVASFTENGDKSYATLDEKEASEELYFNDAETYKFWGVYPAAIGNGAKLVNAQANYTISGSQAPTGTPTTTNVTVDGVAKTLTTLKPDMAQAVMLAAAENQTTQNVELEFYPGFTAFEFTLNSANGELTLDKLELVPASADKSLAGDVAVNAIKVGGTTFNTADNYTITYPSVKALTYTFPDNTKISENNYLTFTVFALPESIDGLTLKFYMNGVEEPSVATLKERGTNGAKNILFTGCNKHCLRGIAVRDGWEFSSITLNLEAIDWNPNEKTSDDYLQASQFEITGNATEDSSTRQLWHVTAGQTFKVSYKVFLPVNGTWSIVPAGDDVNSFTITGTTSGSVVDGGTRVTLEITPKEGSSGKQLYFNTFVTDGGVKYNLDSETQLYDIRGYHYFKVN